MRPLLAVLALASTAAVSADEPKPLVTITLQATLHHVQGIDVEGSTLWVSSVDRDLRKGWISRFTLPSGKLEAQAEVQEGLRFHPGGISLDGDSIWVPVAEYHREGPATIQRRDKTTLVLLQKFGVPDHIGCIAAGPDFLIGGNWDSKRFYRWTKLGTLLSTTPNVHGTSYQDLKITDGALVGSGNMSRTAGAIDWLDVKDYHLIRRAGFGTTDRKVTYTNEGMTIRDGRLYLLPEDDPSRLFVFALP